MSEESPEETAPEAEVDEHDETEPASDEVEEPSEVEPDVETDDAAEDGPTHVEREPWEPTGHASVDRALASLDVLDETSVHDHVAVFEEAHRTLRRALDEAGDDEAGDEETGVPASGLG